jgi:tetratricopeptide (TPR) repeat protein
MRRLILFAALAASLAVLPGQGFAEPKLSAEPGAPPKNADAGRRATLDDLFARLAAAQDETEAKGIANLIERRWLRSGSDTADLLMTRATEALNAKEYPLAIELLDRVITLQPDWAEPWNRRATAFFLLDDPASSMADIRQVLTREPRHFGAWAGLGMILNDVGDERRALVAFRRAVELYPRMERIPDLVKRLTDTVDGRDI